MHRNKLSVFICSQSEICMDGLTPLIQSLENLLSTNPECAVYKQQFLKSITNAIRQLCVQNSIQEWLGEVTAKILHSCWMLHF
jgi:hypothetical protein